MSREIEQFYERASDSRFWDTLRPLGGRDKAVFEMLPARLGTVLDFGFGTGSLLAPVSRICDRAIGVELSQRVIDHCRQNIEQADPALLRRIEFVKTDGVSLPSIPDASVDVVVCASVLEHVFDPYQLLDLLRRIAKPHGVLIIGTPNYAYIKHRLTLLCGNLPRTGTDAPIAEWRRYGWDGGHIHCFTQAALRQLFADCGWQVEAWSGWGDRWPWLKPFRRRYPSLLSGEFIVRSHASAVHAAQKA